jgi:hypothetical protein
MKHIKLFEEFINEIKFADATAFKAYAAKHKMRPSTVVNIGGKDVKAGDVGKEEKEEEEETTESNGTTGFVKPNSMEKDKPSLYIRHKGTMYGFSDSNGGWSEAFMRDAIIKELEDFKVPIAQVLKLGEVRLAGSAEDAMIMLGLKKMDKEEAAQKEAREKQVEAFDEDKDYSEIKVDAASQKAFKALEKDEDVTEFLGYLVHDKSHVTDNTDEVPEMKKVFELTKDVEHKGSLFRGMYSAKASDFKVGQKKSFGRYQSFSESDGVAKGFSGAEKDQGVVLRVDNPKGGFNYGGYLQQNIEKYGEEAGDMNFARYEREHIFDRNQKYEVTKIEDSKPFTIVHIKFI